MKSNTTMSKTERLFHLLQILRRYRYPLSGQFLANELGVSTRIIYRDIAALQAQGADIEGEPGLGYVLKPGFMLPPLMFNEEEIEALVLGSRWVAKKTDTHLQQAAHNALAKIASVLPADLRQQLELSSLLIGPGEVISGEDESLALVRKAIRKELKLFIQYHDLKGNVSTRTIWPIGLGYFDQVRVLIAWCELKKDFRHFRADRIVDVENLGVCYAKRRSVLLHDWRKQNNIPG